MKYIKSLLKRLFITAGLIVLVTGSYAQNDSDAILGFWITEEGKSVVKVFKKDDDKYYAKILWLKNANDDDGNPRKDKENPDDELKSRPIVGIEFMIGFEYNAKDDEWEGKALYDPESGKTYSGYIRMKGSDTAFLRGYVGISLLGRTSQWIRKKEKEK